MRPHRTNNGCSFFVSPEAKAIKRHRNPLGIFSRAFIYPPIGLGAWRHRLDAVAAGAALEVLLWTAVPPVEETFGFIEGAIETELDWLNAPTGPQKCLSLVVLGVFPSSCSRGCGGARGVCWPHPRGS